MLHGSENFINMNVLVRFDQHLPLTQREDTQSEARTTFLQLQPV